MDLPPGGPPGVAVTTLDVTVDSHLRVPVEDLSENVRALIVGALTVQDPDDPDAIPITLYSGDSDGNIVMPRGFALKLKNGLRKMGIGVHWIDRRTTAPIDAAPIEPHIEQREYQSKAIFRMGRVQQGIYEAPPGAGKTVTTCSFIAGLGQRTLVIVDKINIVTQWRDEWMNVTGQIAGQIGDGVLDFERNFVVTTRQSLWAYREQFDDQRWWDQWGCVVLDECHAISSPTTREIIQRFRAKYRFGLSATPDRDSWLTMVSRSVIGEIFCRTTDDELEQAGVLVKPRVIVVKTPFTFPWIRRKDPKIQWAAMVKALKTDNARNSKIAKLFAAQIGRACLVHTDQKMHAYELAGYAQAAGWPADAVLMLTGDQSDAERTAVRTRAAEGNCIIFSTIGQEAMNIPRLDRFFLVWPSKKDYAIKQMIGRIMRTHAEKDAPILFDFWDSEVGVLKDQFFKRRGVYDRLGLRVDFVQ